MALRTETESATRRAYDWTRSRILDGTFAGGTLLSEGEVAEGVGVSRTPVREAFLQLAAEKMLELYPKRGALVVSVTMAELREVLVARGVVEPWAASTLAQRADRATVVAALRALNATLSALQEHPDDREFQEADREFHQCLVTAVGNDLFTTFYSSLRDRQLRSGTLSVQNRPGRESEIVAQHTGIVDAIERGEADAAAEAVASHVSATAVGLGLAPLI
jgi:DNA-binding GntR family transcriptional regulator